MSVLRRSLPAPARGSTMPPAVPSNGSTVMPPSVESGRPPRGRPTRIGSLHVGLVVAAAALVLLVIFLVQNARTVEVSFLGGHLRVSLAVAMLIAAVAGALIVGAAGAARIGQLRHSARRSVRTNDVR
jgi:uncharacterized integral membrane protein